jgi:hypothetical protein
VARRCSPLPADAIVATPPTDAGDEAFRRRPRAPQADRAAARLRHRRLDLPCLSGPARAAQRRWRNVSRACRGDAGARPGRRGSKPAGKRRRAKRRRRRLLRANQRFPASRTRTRKVSAPAVGVFAGLAGRETGANTPLQIPYGNKEVA